MRLRTARQMWHDATLTNCRSSFDALIEIERLGVSVQSTVRCQSNEQIVHGVLAGHVLSVIDKLPRNVRAFGNYMYSAEPSRADMQAALYEVHNTACVRHGKISAAKRKAAIAVADAVLCAYRRRHQGGQSEGMDMFPTAESLREHVRITRGLSLDSRNWARDWGGFIEQCNAVCSELDGKALSPVGALLYLMKEDVDNMCGK